MVPDQKSLRKYKFCGHGMLTGQKGQAWQDADYVLKYFAADLKTARRKYLAYVRAGLDQGRRPELVGGGLIRSLGGWTEVKKKRRTGMKRIKGDQRILGDTAFVQTMLKQAKENI